MIRALFAISAAAAAYQALALLAALRFLRRRDPEPRELPPVSVLKPLRGVDAGLEDCVRSQVAQDYPEYEVLFGVSDPGDPAASAVRRTAPEARLIVSTTPAENGKVGVLADLATAARYPVLLVSDSDIRVPPDYLRRVVAPLADGRVGLVTCLYRARAAAWPGRFEALGIATDFASGVLVAPYAGVSEFALGSTMVFRAKDLARIGGFASIAGYIADDYQLGRRLHDLGMRVWMSRCVVETALPDTGWAGMWRHQLRWARTVRVSRGGGYAGLPVTFATLWAIALAAAGHPWLAAALLALRLAAGLVTGAGVLGDRAVLRYAWLIPARDLFGVAVWAAGLLGNQVVWRDRRLRLTRSGRIRPEAS